jgi:hypothetical protein
MFVPPKKLRRFYSIGSDLHLYDGFGPQHRLARGPILGTKGDFQD